MRLRALLLVLMAGPALAQPVPASGALPSPPAFSSLAPGPLPPPWRIAGLPGQKTPLTQFAVVDMLGRAVLRVATDASYGNLVFDTRKALPTAQTMLRWSWRLERGLSDSDLSSKQGDDTPIKVCVLFDMPLDGLGLGERTQLRLARSLSGEHLPGATLCYVWDRLLPAGTLLANIYSPRVRYIVASSGAPDAGRWDRHERLLGADFMRAFGDETLSVPPILALVVGADADNTLGKSLAYVGDVTMAP